MKPLVAKTLAIAESRIGVREIGRTNRGRLVDEFNRSTGAALGSPWCAGFTYDNKQDAADELDVPNPFIRSAYTPDIFNWARERSILIPCIQNGKVNLPEPGDDFLVMGPVRIYHTGHVQKVVRDGFWKIEGNSNDEGSNEGYEVARNFAPFHHRYYFVRWSALCADEVTKPQTRKLYLGGKLTPDPLPVAENVTLAPVRKWCYWMGGKRVDWIKGSDAPVRINGEPFECELTSINGVMHAPVRELAALDPDLIVSFDAKTQSVYVTRTKPKMK